MKCPVLFVGFLVSCCKGQFVDCPVNNNNIVCRPDEKLCPMPTQGPDVCPAPPLCIPAKIPSSKTGNGMCENVCPAQCLGNDIICPQGEDIMGCKMADICVPQLTDAINECPKLCTVVCRPDEILCNEPSFGKCPGPTYCIPKAKKILIEYECPGFCPVSCLPDQILCRKPVDDKGCEQPGTCISARAPSSNVNVTCPNHCPVTSCNDNEILCAGQVAQDGCKSPDTCVPKMLGTDNKLCPGTCPTTCPLGSKPCSPIDANGCPSPTTCIPYFVPGTSGNVTCVNFCPVACQNGFTLCPGPIDPLGCKVMDTCYPIQVGFNNSPCPPSCPMFCADGLVLCPPKTGANGCQIQGTCVSDPTLCT